jgi:HK97 family phage prohead protease
VNRPQPGAIEQRALDLTVDGKRIRGRIPYNVESRDLGGFREVIEPTALRGAKVDELVATVDHAGVPIGRHPGTLELDDRSDGLHWSVDPPQSRRDVVEAIERGDLRGGSFRMRVARDEWRGDVRHVLEIAELRDVAVVTNPAYPSAVVELRNHDPAEAEEDPMADTADNTIITDDTTEDRSETPSPEATPRLSGLQVEDRTTTTPPRGLADAFRAAGFPSETASIAWQDFENRAVTWSGSVDTLNRVRRDAVPFGYDARWLWPAFGRVAVDEGVTSVDVATQTARSLATPANVVRAIDAVTNKPETGSTLQIVTTALKQLATVQSGIPNVYLESQALSSVVENDLTLALNDALDKLILDAIAASGFQAPGADTLLVSVRKAITTLSAAGYQPDVLALTPAAAEALDVLVSGIAGGTSDFVFSPGQFAPGTIFGLQRRISKTIPAPAVIDSGQLGKMYASRVSLARFEENAGKTNTSLVRLETHAVFGTERQAAAVRVAAA